MLDLSHQWGLSNRTQTLVFWATWASMHQSGIYVLWTKTEACDCLFEDIFDEAMLNEAPFSKVPFIRVFGNKHDKFWTAPPHSYY